MRPGEELKISFLASSNEPLIHTHTHTHSWLSMENCLGNLYFYTHLAVMTWHPSLPLPEKEVSEKGKTEGLKKMQRIYNIIPQMYKI